MNILSPVAGRPAAPLSRAPDLAAAILAAARHVLIELTGFTETMRDRLRAYGLFTEVIAWKLRFFVPVGADGPAVLARLLDTYAIARVTEREAA